MTLVWIALLALGVGFIYADTLAGINFNWQQLGDAYGHGYLVLATSLYLVYEERVTLFKGESKPSWLFLGVTALTSFAWFLAHYLSIQVAEQALLPILLLSAIGSLFGSGMVLRLLFPLSLIYLAIPVWDILITPLQTIATTIVGNSLYAIGIPTHISGFMVDIPSGRFEVAGGCAGLRYLTAGMMIAALYGRWNASKSSQRIVLFIAGMIVSIVSNWIRIATIIIIGHVTEMKSPLVADHDNLGWVIFAISLGLYLLGGHFYLRKTSVTDTKVIPVDTQAQSSWVTAPGIGYWILTAMAILAIPAALQVSEKLRTDNYQTRGTIHDIKGWSESTPSINTWSPDYKGFGNRIQQSLTDRKQHRITVTILEYPHERQGDSELIHYDNHLVDDAYWLAISSSTDEIVTADSAIPVNIDVITSAGNQKLLVYSWFQVSDKFTRSRIGGKLLSLRSLVKSPRRPSSLISYAINCQKSCEEEQPLIVEFIKDSIGQIR